jgi:hypothetical protein
MKRIIKYFLLLLPIYSYCQKDTIVAFKEPVPEPIVKEYNNLIININQTFLPGAYTVSYRIENSKLKVYLISPNGKTRLKYKTQLNQMQKDSILYCTIYILDQNYDSTYYSAVMDGVHTEVIINLNMDIKKYYLDNYYIDSFDKLISVINESLPEKKQYIRLDWFGMQKK